MNKEQIKEIVDLVCFNSNTLITIVNDCITVSQRNLLGDTYKYNPNDEQKVETVIWSGRKIYYFNNFNDFKQAIKGYLENDKER